MGPDSIHQRKVPGFPGQPLALGTVAEPDHFSHPLAERDATGLVAARRLGDIGLDRTRGLLFGANRIAIGIAPSRPEALKSGRRSWARGRRLCQHRGRRQKERPSEADTEQRSRNHGRPNIGFKLNRKVMRFRYACG